MSYNEKNVNVILYQLLHEECLCDVHKILIYGFLSYCVTVALGLCQFSEILGSIVRRIGT